MNDSGKASGESSPADDAALPTTIYAAGILRASPRCEPDSLGSQYTPKSRTMRLIRHRLALLGYRNGAVEARQPRRHDWCRALWHFWSVRLVRRVWSLVGVVRIHECMHVRALASATTTIYPMTLSVLMMTAAFNHVTVLKTVVLILMIVVSLLLLARCRRVWIAIWSDALPKTSHGRSFRTSLIARRGIQLMRTVHVYLMRLKLQSQSRFKKVPLRAIVFSSMISSGIDNSQIFNERDINSLLQVWNVFVYNGTDVGRQPCMDKLDALRHLFKRR